MTDDQLALPFDSSPELLPGPVPHLRAEIARIWALPLGEHVEIAFRPAFPLAGINGILELRSSPDLPWNPRRPLDLRIAPCDFTSRDIDHWKLL